eukprot:TRINITY_DN24349_c0_g1_i2.p1 TRINITY_DN24349_c0_g1~~TRINITY_DN24349_c0_g1_i2.p1  ORF type:complete len:129 (-),score=19.03 TRINITY_DN24349_c0_g1_i2:86-472(-)
MQPDCIERYNSHVAFRRVMTGCSLTDVANRLQQGKTYAYEKLEGAVGQERLIQTTSCAEQVQAKAGIFKRRLTNILDTSTDLLVVIDNATTWNGPYIREVEQCCAFERLALFQVWAAAEAGSGRFVEI